MDQIVPARISADFGRVANDDNPSGHPSRGSDPASGVRGAGSPSLVGGRGRGAEREAPAGSPSRVANFVLALYFIMYVTSRRAACGRKTGVGSGAVGVEVVVEVCTAFMVNGSTGVAT